MSQSDAGVARSAAYRRWPYKDLFWADVLVDLASGVPPALRYDDAAARQASELMLSWLDRLDDPQNRLAAAADVMRDGALREVQSFDRSRAWRTYFAIQTTFFGLSDGELRARVQEAIAGAEHELTAVLATTYQSVTELLGLRIPPDTGLSYDDLDTLGMGSVRGLVLMMPSNPGLTDDHYRRAAPDSTGDLPWTLPGIGLAAVTVDQLEIDPRRAVVPRTNRADTRRAARSELGEDPPPSPRRLARPTQRQVFQRLVTRRATPP